jgi:hypothetical protein
MSHATSNAPENHTFGDFLYWTMLAALPVLVACFAIARQSLIWLLVYLALLAGLAILVYRCFCTHCPHYIHSAGRTRCMFFWNMPQLFRPRPGKLSLLEKSGALLAGLVLVVLPGYWLWQARELLIIYLLGWVNLGMTMRRYACPHCPPARPPLNEATRRG